MVQLTTEEGDVLQAECMFHGQREVELRFDDEAMAFTALNSDISTLTLANGEILRVRPPGGESFVMRLPVYLWFNIRRQS